MTFLLSGKDSNKIFHRFPSSQAPAFVQQGEQFVTQSGDGGNHHRLQEIERFCQKLSRSFLSFVHNIKLNDFWTKNELKFGIVLGSTLSTFLVTVPMSFVFVTEENKYLLMAFDKTGKFPAASGGCRNLRSA